MASSNETDVISVGSLSNSSSLSNLSSLLATCFSPEVSRVARRVNGAWIEVGFLFVFFFVGVVGNAIVVIVYPPAKHKNVHIYFVYVLAIIDLVVSIFLIPNAIFFTFLDYICPANSSRPSLTPSFDPSFHVYRVIATVSLNSLLMLSCLLFVAIAVDRLEAVVSPLRRRFDFAVARTYCWSSLFCVVVCVTLMVIDDNPDYHFSYVIREKSGHTLVYNLTKLIFDIVVFSCFLTMVVVYAIVFYKIRKLGIKRATFRKHNAYERDINDRDEEVDIVHDDDDDDNNGKDNVTRSSSERVVDDFRMTTEIHKKDAELMWRTLLIATWITGFFIFSWLPSIVIQHWLIGGNPPVLRKLVFMNSVVNPIIYAVTNEDFRRLVRHRFGD